METTLATAPAKEPLSLTDAKQHLRIDSTNFDNDGYIKGLIETARRYVETYTWRKLITQTWYAYYTDWPDGDFIELPYGSLQSVTSVKYYDTDNTEYTWDTDEYIVDTDSLHGKIVLADGYTWPNENLYPSNPIKVEFVCGYGDNPSDVPYEIRHAIKMFISDLYENREPTLINMSFSTMDTMKNLLENFRLNKL